MLASGSLHFRILWRSSVSFNIRSLLDQLGRNKGHVPDILLPPDITLLAHVGNPPVQHDGHEAEIDRIWHVWGQEKEFCW